MNYYLYLKKKFPVYIISGIIISLTAFTAVALNRYDNHLSNILYDLETIGLNKNKIQNKVREIDSINSYFKSKYKIDITDVNSEREILKALDRMKGQMPEARITATKFNRDMGTMLLPVDIQLRIDSYNVLIDTVEYLDSFRVPDYTIRGLQIAEGSANEFVLIINGALSMPGFQI